MRVSPSNLDWNKILTLNREYPTDEEVQKGNDVPEWDRVPQTTPWERWTYYLYYNGNNGINNYTYVPTMVQYLISQNGWDPTQGAAGEVSCGINDAPCEVMLGNSSVSVASIILLNNGLNALIQAILLTTIGSLADYGNNSAQMLIVITVISCAAQISFLAFDDTASQYWGVPLLIGLIFQITYGASLVFYWAVFPVLAVNDPKVRAAKRSNIDQDDYVVIESITRNHISAVSTAWSNIGFVIISVLNIIVGNSLARHYKVSWDAVPEYSNSIYSAICGGYWLLCAIPWFIVQKHRPGPSLPPRANYFTYGWKEAGRAVKEYRRLPQTFLFLIGYFFLSDAVGSMNSVVGVLTVNITNYDGLLQTYMNLINAACSIIGCFGFLYVQKHFQLSTKTMLQISTGFSAVAALWGCVGIGSNSFGYHTEIELWIYNAWFGLFTAPFYAYSQTLMSELIPTGQENKFFALFGIVSKVAQFFGPALISGVTEATRIIHTGFIFCAVAQILPLIIIGYINMEQAEVRLKVYEEQERRKTENINDILQGGGVDEDEILYIPPSVSSVAPSSNQGKTSDGHGYGF
ncbi:autophagy-related protein 22-like protein [Fennellomyces sp. T-0311]|nr:autophagy-related protein 22-like protein [Fennellomyces sp. T-0311]